MGCDQRAAMLLVISRLQQSDQREPGERKPENVFYVDLILAYISLN